MYIESTELAHNRCGVASVVPSFGSRCSAGQCINNDGQFFNLNEYLYRLATTNDSLEEISSIMILIHKVCFMCDVARCFTSVNEDDDR